MSNTNIFDKSPNESKGDVSGKERLRRAVEHVRQFMLESDRYRKPHLDLAKESRELYECWSREGRSPINRANLKMPYGYSAIESLTPQITETFLQERPFLRFDGNEPMDMQYEESLTDFFDMQLESMNFSVKWVAFVKAMLLDGTAFAKVPYRYEEKTIEENEIVEDPLKPGRLEQIKREILKVAFDGPDFEPIPFQDMFPDWRVKLPGDVGAMRGIAFRTWRNMSELKANRKYKNLDELEQSAKIKGGYDQAWKEPYYSEEGRFDRLNDNQRGVKNKDQVEIWEYWGLFDDKNDGEFKEFIITVANGDVCLRCEENPFKYKMKPFVACPNVVRAGEFFGIPELIAVRNLIKESNALKNARLDQVNLSVNRMYLVDRASGIKARSLYSRPSGIVWTNDMGGMRAIEPPQIPPDAFREGDAMAAEIQSAMGIVTSNPQLPQLAKTFGRSATGVNFINNVSASRVGLKVRMLSELALKPMYDIMLKMNAQFVSDDQWVRVSDPEKAQLNPFTLLPANAFQRAIDFKLKSTVETGGQENEFQKLQMLAQVLQTAEATQPGVTNWEVLFESIGRSLLGPRYKKFIRSADERMQMQQQQLAAQQSANARAGAQAPQPNELAAEAGIDPELAAQLLAQGGGQ